MTAYESRSTAPEVRQSLSRRQFIGSLTRILVGGSLLGVGVKLFFNRNSPPLGLLARLFASPNRVLERLNLAAFSTHLGESFQLYQQGTPVDPLRLVEVSDLASSSAATDSRSESGEVFSLIWHGATRGRLSQDTYLFESADLGVFPLLMAPIYSDGDGWYYEAIINRSHP